MNEKIEEIKLAFSSTWCCNSIDHNEPDGCSNPECFNHDPPHPAWKEFEESFDKAFDKITGKGFTPDTE